MPSAAGMVLADPAYSKTNGTVFIHLPSKRGPAGLGARAKSTVRPATVIKYAKVDADTGEEVSNEDIMKGYKVDTDTYIEVSKDELDNIALESTRTIDIDEFVPKSSIDRRYLIRPSPDSSMTAASNSTTIRSSAPSGRSRSGARTICSRARTVAASDGQPSAPSSPPQSSTTSSPLPGSQTSCSA
jgi:hypothetical protein